MAELYFGEGKGIEDFLVVTVEAGVGLGIVLGGRIYRGTRGCGAEFGHMKVQIDGALCRCGQRGCLEAYVADYALLREAALRPGTQQQPPPARAAATARAFPADRTSAVPGKPVPALCLLFRIRTARKPSRQPSGAAPA